MGAVVRRAEGEKLKGKKDQLELEDLKESLDLAAEDGKAEITTMMGDAE